MHFKLTDPWYTPDKPGEAYPPVSVGSRGSWGAIGLNSIVRQLGGAKFYELMLSLPNATHKCFN